LHRALESGDCQTLDNLPGNVTPALGHHLAAFLCKGSLIHGEKQIAAAEGLPVKAVSFIQDGLVEFRQALLFGGAWLCT
jgi:hypothetical protein